MKLLVTAQVLDQSDPVLGFFHEWIKEIAGRVDHVEVICLKVGSHDLPENVQVHSLGKEMGARSQLSYACQYVYLVWKLRGEYDRVFIHMNQEYILVAGWLLKLLGKPIYLWRNHYAGSWLTDVAAAFCTKVFCTSKHSYTARYDKTVRMPVGVDTERFYIDSATPPTPHSILFLSRMSPSKQPDLFIETLGILSAKGIPFKASVYGSPLPPDEAYYESLIARAETLKIHDRVHFYASVTHEKAAEIFRAHEVFVNCSPSGMFDKTLFEAALSGAMVLAASKDFGEETDMANVYEQGNSADLVARLEAALTLAPAERVARSQILQKAGLRNSLTVLATTLVQEMNT